VELKWDTPLDHDIKVVSLYRGEEGKEPVLIATLEHGEERFADSKVLPGNSYYYYFATENAKGKKTPLSLPAGIEVR
jgi:hypothetical protein